MPGDVKDRLAVSGWNVVTVLMRRVCLLITCVCEVLVITGDPNKAQNFILVFFFFKKIG